MSKFKDVTGQKFGRLTALHRLHNTKGKTKWLCICDCGNLKEVTLNLLQRGETKSCGCLHKEFMKKQFGTHGKTGTRLHRIWKNMHTRCYNKNISQYKDWGGRGIKICDEWKDNFQTFYDWSMSNGYNDKLSIDRIDNNGNYEPSNCRWATVKQQNRNSRQAKQITFNGETHCIKEWCEILGINYNTYWTRVTNLGWSTEKALNYGKVGDVIEKHD